MQTYKHLYSFCNIYPTHPQMKNAIVIFAALLLLASCKQTANTATQTTEINAPTSSVGAGNKVVFLCDYYSAYLDAVRKGCKNTDSLYTNVVSNPVLKKYFMSCEMYELIQGQFAYTKLDTTGLAARISSIMSKKDVIEKALTTAFVDCNKYLKNDSITVFITPFGGGYMEKIIRKMGGIAAVTPGSKVIVLTIVPDEQGWENTIGTGIAHEYHHACWMKRDIKTTQNWDMLTYIVFEGRANAYAKLVYPNYTAPWDTILHGTGLTEYWQKTRPMLKNQDMELQRKVMFGDYKNYVSFPLWGGYCLGYNIVESVLKNNPKLTPEEWTDMQPEKILELSDFK